MDKFNAERFAETLQTGLKQLDNLSLLPPEFDHIKDRVNKCISAMDMDGLKLLKKELELMKKNQNNNVGL